MESETTHNARRMPAKPVMVDETIARFDVAGLRSQLLQLDTKTLQGLGLLLTDRTVTVMGAWDWLNRELGGDAEDPAVQRNAVYRFAEHFRRLYGQVRREHAQRVARLTVSDATAGNAQIMRQVASHRLAELVAERLAESDSLEDINAGELGNIISALTAQQQGQIKLQELQLKQAESDRKTQRLEDDLRTAEARRQEITQKIARLPERIRAVESQLDRAEKRTKAGKTVDPKVYASIRQELIAMAREAGEASHA